MAPLVFSNWWAAGLAAALFVYLLSIELGTSRNASRSEDGSSLELETTTGKLVDIATAIAMLGGLASALWWHQSVVDPRLGPFVAGLVCMASGGVLSISARRHLGRFHRDDLTHHDDHELISSGPYSRIRHPLYTATILAFLGIGLTLGTWVSIGLVALPFAALLYRIRVEEALLGRALGQTYGTYAKGRARLIPGVW